MVRAGEVILAVIASFARVPVPGEIVLLWLTDSQRARLGAEFEYGKSNCIPAIVRDTVLRPRDRWRTNMPSRWAPADIMEDHVADLFADAITKDGWHAKTARWVSGDG